jgi:hypothetical protein
MMRTDPPNERNEWPDNESYGASREIMSSPPGPSDKPHRLS